jgi:hypothetical protein
LHHLHRPRRVRVRFGFVALEGEHSSPLEVSVQYCKKGCHEAGRVQRTKRRIRRSPRPGVPHVHRCWSNRHHSRHRGRFHAPPWSPNSLTAAVVLRWPGSADHST